MAAKAHVSPAFLSRILNREPGLPSDKAILRLAEALDLQPPERLLIEAGRVPEEWKPALSQVGAPELLRSFGELSEDDHEKLVKSVQDFAFRQRRANKN